MCFVGLPSLEWGELQPASVVERGEWLIIRCASVAECVCVHTGVVSVRFVPFFC
jgi:hypothetical protein